MSEQLDDWIAAWLRGDISATDREKLEQRLAEDPELREELDELKQLHEFEQYHSGQLSAPEATAFAERLAGDETLQQEYGDYQATRRVLEIDRISIEQDAVRAEIERQRAKKKDEPPRSPSWRKWLPIFIGLVLVALSFPFWPLDKKGTIPSIEFFPVYEPPPSPDPPAPDDPGDAPVASPDRPVPQEPVLASLIEEAMQTPYPRANDVPLGGEGITDIQRTYQREAYTELREGVSTSLVDSLIATGDRTRDIVLLASARLLASPPQCQSAYDLLAQLEKTRAQQLGGFMQAADWYRAISLLCLEQREQALPILRAIATAGGGHEFKRAAQDLLSTLGE